MTRFRIRKKLGNACTKAKYTTLKALTRENTSSGKLIAQVITPVIAVTAVIGIGVPAHAYQIFFGKDSRPGFPDFPRLPSTPNADAARDQFFSNLGSSGTETFEGFTPGSTQPLTLSFPGVGTGIFDGRGIIRNVSTGTIDQGLYPISGNQFLQTANRYYPLPPPSSETATSSITFSDSVAAFGFYATDLGDVFISPTSLALTLANGTTQRLLIPGTLSSGSLDVSVHYYGIIAQDLSEVFTKVTFEGGTSRVDGFGLDDVTVAKLDQVKPSEPIPEPLTILGSLAAGGVGVALRRKFKQQKNSALE